MPGAVKYQVEIDEVISDIGSLAYTDSTMQEITLANGETNIQLDFGGVTNADLFYMKSDQALSLYFALLGTEIPVTANKPVIISGTNLTTIYLTNQSGGSAHVNWKIYGDSGASTTPATSDLSTALANTSNVALGDAMIGYKGSNSDGIFTGAIARTVHDRFGDLSVSVKDFGAIGDGSTDDTTAFQAAVDAVTNGWTIKVPPGKYKFSDEVTLNAGISIEGYSHGDFMDGTPALPVVPSFIFQSTDNKAIFVINGGMSDISIRDLSLSPALVPSHIPEGAGKWGIKLSGSYPQFVWNLVFERITFYNLDRAISCVDPLAGTGTDWSVAPVTVRDCSLYYPTIGIYFDTVNADDWVVNTCLFFIPTDGHGLYLERCGFLKVSNCIANGATVNNNKFITIIGNGIGGIDDIVVENCEAEVLSYFIVVDVSGSFYPPTPFNLTVRDCKNQAGAVIGLDNTVNFLSIGNQYQESVLVSSTGATIESLCDRFYSTHITFSGSATRPQILTYLPSQLPDSSIDGWIIESKLIQWAGYPPLTGDHLVGDILFEPTPIDGGNIGAICITAGTPGTWKAFGGLTAQYVNWNAAANVSDGGDIGYYAMGSTPTAVIAVPTIGGEMVSVTAIGTTTFTVAIKKHDGTAGTVQTIYWMAIL